MVASDEKGLPAGGTDKRGAHVTKPYLLLLRVEEDDNEF